MKKMKRYIAFILSVIISLCVMQVRGINVLSVKAETLGDFTVSGDAGGYSYSDNILTISSGGEYTIGMAEGVTETKSDRIKVTSNQDVTITFDGLNGRVNFFL